jgi:hypothetical protein
MQCPNKLAVLIALAFLLPVVVVCGMNYETIKAQLTPHPDNGYMIYLTSRR